jgi:hypothetical protein
MAELAGLRAVGDVRSRPGVVVGPAVASNDQMGAQMSYGMSNKLRQAEGDDAPEPDRRHTDGVTLLAFIDSLARMQPPPGSPLPTWTGWLQDKARIHRLLAEAFRIADHAHRMQVKHLDRQIVRLTHRMETDAEADGTAQVVPGELCAMCSTLPEHFRPPYVEWVCHICHGGKGGHEVCLSETCPAERS